MKVKFIIKILIGIKKKKKVFEFIQKMNKDKKKALYLKRSKK